jgi:ATP:ADP antiporter, AAA family
MAPILTREIRPEERRGAAGAFLTLFGILTAHTLLETARDALFLARLPASQLPWVYLAMAAVAVVLSELPWPARQRSVAGSLSALLVGCAAVTFGFWAFGTWRSSWMVRTLYVWTGLLGTLTALQFWLVMSELYTITQAKRVYRFIATGSLLGAVAGAMTARVMSMQAPAERLVLASAVVLALTSVVPMLLLRRGEGGALMAPAPAGVLDAVRVLRANPYVSRLAGLVLVSTVVLTLADYVFKSAVAKHVAPGDLGGFFATVYVVLNVTALLVQLIFMGWVLRILGLDRALWMLPILILVGAGGVAVGGGLVAALILKGADGSLRHSLHRTSTELLFVPIPDGIRQRAKPLIDVVGQRGGQALASVLILSELKIHGDAALAGVAAALCIVWIAWAVELKPHYLELFRVALRQGTMRRHADAPDLDLGSLETLFSALNSREDAEVVGALELLAEEDRVRLIPALILYHPSAAVVLRSLELFAAAERADFVPIADRLLAHPDPEVRAAALRARSAVEPDEASLRRATDDPSLLVRATGLVGLIAGGWITEDVRATFDTLLRDSPVEGPRALARAIGHRPAPLFEDVLLELAKTRDPEVLMPTAQAMGMLRSKAFLDALLDMLVPHESRDAARTALLAYGEDALTFLEEALSDPELPHEIRRHLPRTISRFPADEAAPVLLRHLVQERDGMVRFKILRGLGRMATEHPDVPLDRDVLVEGIDRTLEATFRLIHWRLTLMRGAVEVPRRHTPGHELLLDMLRDKERHAVERAFRILGLLYRGENFETIYRGLLSTDPKVRASSRELLENAVGAPLRTAVMAIVDDSGEEARLAGSGTYYNPVPLGYEELMATLLDQPGETLRCLAAYHVGELGLQSLRGKLEAFLTRETGFFVTRVVERALRLLAQQADRRLLLAE